MILVHNIEYENDKKTRIVKLRTTSYQTSVSRAVIDQETGDMMAFYWWIA